METDVSNRSWREALNPIHNVVERRHKRFKDWFEIINVKTAKVGPRLAWLLRHGARYHNLYVRPDGYALVDEVLRISPFRNLNLPDLKELARIDPLKRLQVKELRPHQWWIRATARHSLKFVNPAWKEIRNAREVEGCIYYADGNEWQKIRTSRIPRMFARVLRFDLIFSSQVLKVSEQG
ncbi:hypothetical protein HHX47_DHR6000772 [Lentinula edodes]|nr:hypothetical protein HHX47_DHR6000772 [Lentinula edodes]